MTLNRRTLLAGAAGAAAPQRPALIAITLDLEMSRNFPKWEDVHWDYEKGNLNAETRRYAREACRRVKARGGVVHCFALGRTLEQEDVEWLREIAREGHPIGNHTYDHVNVLATRPEDVQFRFRRAPWLIEGKTPRQVIEENIRLTARALKQRIGVEPAGFRTPGGFADGLSAHAEVRRMLLDQGYRWVSSRYPAHPVGEPGRRPGREVFESIVAAQRQAQPSVYPDGLVEVPMSPISDINAFRNGRWRLDDFLEAVRRAAEWAIDQRAAFDFLGHPSCLYVTDPSFRTVDLICDLVAAAGARARLVDLNTVARAARVG
jgi:peptidoglycan/xylan/chitin deacetylase (PgdA/CDA1 family)